MSTPEEDHPSKRYKHDIEEKKSLGRAPRFLSPLDLVTIIAAKGPEIKEFKIHKEYACEHSPIFKAAFSSVFIEGQTQTYKLDDATPEVIRLLCGWLYSQKLDFDTAMNWVSQADAKAFGLEKATAAYEQNIENMNTLVELWIIADKLLIPRLQNLVIRTIEDCKPSQGIWEVCLYRGYFAKLSNYILEHTSETSQLRRKFVEEVARFIVLHADEAVAETIRRQVPGAILLDAMLFLSKRMSKKAKKELDASTSTPRSSFEVPEH